jgi:hypothetical protein
MLPVDNLIGVVGITVLVKPHLGGQPIRGASLGEQDLVSEWEGGTSPKENGSQFLYGPYESLNRSHSSEPCQRPLCESLKRDKQPHNH